MYLFRITVRISNFKKSCTHEASDSRFHYGQIMQFIVTYAIGIYSYLYNISFKI